MQEYQRLDEVPGSTREEVLMYYHDISHRWKKKEQDYYREEI